MGSSKTKKTKQKSNKPFDTSANFDNMSWGFDLYDEGEDDYIFHPLGRKVTLEEIALLINKNYYVLKLSFQYMGAVRRITLPRGSMGDYSCINHLLDAGADVSRKYADVFFDTIRLQEYALSVNGVQPTLAYENLGWIWVPVTQKGKIKRVLCYQSSRLIQKAELTAQYTGNFYLFPTGSMEAWKQMVKDEVIGNIPLEIVLLISLAAIVNGLLALKLSVENPIVHLCAETSTGKSTAGYLAASVFGKPFEGETTVSYKDGTTEPKRSIYQSWGATENALVRDMAGNCGAVVILNELGKSKVKDLGQMVYNMSEGTDKKRLNQSLTANVSAGYHTTILSIGEISLLDKCGKEGGLRNRVLEITETLTKDAGHSRRLKDGSINHNGWAAPKLAEFLLDQGGTNYAVPIYKKWQNRLTEESENPRFVEKFSALFLTTAEIAEAALGIQFSVDEIISFMNDCEQKRKESDPGIDSYRAILEDFRVHNNNFMHGNNTAPGYESWGKYESASGKQSPGGQAIVGRYVVRPSILKERLAQHGFNNLTTCVKAWCKMGLLEHDADRLTRKRKLDKGAEIVYVLCVLDVGPPASVTGEEEQSAPHRVRKSSRLSKEEVQNLLKDDDDVI